MYADRHEHEHRVQGLMLEAQKTDPTMPTLGMFTLTPVGVPVPWAGHSSFS